jgi:hypothetical protein
MQLSRIADDMIGSEVLSAAKLPKYLRLSNAILNLIESGEMRPGDKLPPEGALAWWYAITGVAHSSPVPHSK